MIGIIEDENIAYMTELGGYNFTLTKQEALPIIQKLIDFYISTDDDEILSDQMEETETEETESEEIPETESEKPEQPEGWSLGKVLEALGSAPEQLMDSVSSIKDQFGFGRK